MTGSTIGIKPAEHDSVGSATTAESRAAGRAYPGIAWLVILLAVSVVALLNSGILGKEGGRAGAINAVLDLQNRYLIGTMQLAGGRESIEALIDTQLTSSDPHQLLSATLILAESVGPEAALRELDQRVDKLQRTPTQERATEALRQLYRQRIDQSLNRTTPFPQESRDLIAGEFGWLGRLGLNPDAGGDPEERKQLQAEALRTTATMIGAAAAASCGGFLGFGLLMVFVVLLAQNRLQFRLQPHSGTGGYYAEMFAVWFVLFFLLNVGLVSLSAPGNRIALAGVASLLSLGALAWPVWRGIPWRQVRTELGLIWPKSGVTDLALGVIAYPAALPVVFVGMLGTLLVMRLMASVATVAIPLAEVPAHPVVELFAHGTLVEKLQAVAVVLLVPITEEIMFRGALYRHLREATGPWARVVSLMFSLVFSSLLFAAIHPQGIAGIPLLTSIAIVLGILREWRGSLVTPVVTHMVVNGVTSSLALLALS